MANKANINQIDQIVKKVGEEALQACKTRVIEEMTWRAKECIAEFYDEYYPRYYDRWGQLETTPNEVDTVVGNKYVFGVEINADDMKDLYKISAESVFDLAIVKGFHGLPDYPGSEDNPGAGIKIGKSTIEKMDEYFEIIKKKIPAYFQEEMNKAWVKYYK